ncbi:MAG: hypothetical protein P1P64_04400 [Treponemataceae bacterium]
MKYKVTIEETIVETFEVDIPKTCEPLSFIVQNYKKGNLVLCPGECQFRQMKLHNCNDATTSDWIEF